MLPLTDSRWKSLHGGYKLPYDASITLARMEKGEDVWNELWDELHHQGDVGEASYAAVPHLVRISQGLSNRSWQLYSLVSTIEIERHRKSNPALPDWLEASYQQSILDLGSLGISDLQKATDPLLIQSILGAIAISKGALKLGALVSYLDDSELNEILESQQAWSQLYA